MTYRKPKKGRFFVGSVGVDAGLVWVGDPCYIKDHPELYDQSKWMDFCDNIRDLPREKYGGVCTHTNWGDGEYPVYVTFDSDGSPAKLEVVFTRMTTDRDESKGIEYQSDDLDGEHDE